MENPYQKALTIKEWAEEDRPREKLVLKGKSALSDAELLAILLGSGSRDETAVELAKKILKTYDNSLHLLGKTSVKELENFKGIGEAKAVTVIAALEIGRRRQLTDIREQPQIRSSSDAYHLIAPFLVDIHHEEFWILMLNHANHVIARENISKGGVAGTVADAKIIFKRALLQNASSIILVHNHPSGNLKPSHADIDITKKLKQAGIVLEIGVLDHLIISERGFFSFMDEGIF
jgi:DNA repair protein RadC